MGAGKAAFREQEFQIARQHLAGALAVFTELDIKLAKAEALYALGELAWSQEDGGAEAQELLESALSLYEQLGALQGQAQSLILLGEIADLKEFYPRARHCLREAADRYRRQKLHAQEALVQLALGKLEIRADQIGEARKHYEQAVVLYEIVGDEVGQAQVLFAHGQLDERQRSLRQAVEHYAQALAIMDSIDGSFREQIWRRMKPAHEEFSESLPDECKEWQESRERELEIWHDMFG